MKNPKRIEHAPVLTMQLAQFAAMLGIGIPDEDQSDKNPECAYAAGELDCLNAADSLCDDCGWWDRQAQCDEWEDEDYGEDDV